MYVCIKNLYFVVMIEYCLMEEKILESWDNEMVLNLMVLFMLFKYFVGFMKKKGR